MRLSAFSKNVSAEMLKKIMVMTDVEEFFFENHAVLGGKWLTHLFNRQMCHN